MKRKLVYLVCFFISLNIHADEGMWLLKELNKQSIDRMKELGFTFPINDVYDENNPSLKDAVVIFGGGCTGVVVSDNGLIFTNHHCGYGSIQRLSSLEHDYLKDGFASNTFEEEIPAPELTISFLDKTEDISEYMTSTLVEGDTQAEREKKTDSLALAYIKQYDGHPYLQVRIVPFYNNNKYYAVTYKVFKDVRLVFTPPSSVGKFGGETDNWMWPRHTGDFSVFRVYADENNNPASYNENNKPYTPKYSVPISIKGYDDEQNSYSMTIGYPGRTKRYMSSWGVEQMVESEHKPRIAVRGVKQDIWKKAMNSYDAIHIKYASKYAGSSNYWKNAKGMNQAIENLNVIEKKQDLENNFSTWVSENKDREVKYGQTLDRLKRGYTNTNESMKVFTYFSETFSNGIELIRIANSYIPEADKSTPEKVIAARSRLTNVYTDYDPILDQEVTAALLRLYKESVSPEYLPSIYNKIESEFNDDFEAYTAWLFTHTQLTNLESATKFIEENDKDGILMDPAIELSLSLRPILKKIGDSIKLSVLDLNQGNREFMAGLMEMYPEKTFYPDANFTQRLSYGSVKGYSTWDTVEYDYFTTTDGVLAKEIKNDPEFNVQDYILNDIESANFGEYTDKDGSMHVNFLSNNDITGGNSGSPVFNGKAELIGLAFDGNWDALSGDIIFNSEIQRCINVDIRYVLYMIDKVGKCSRLIEELDIHR